MKYALIFSGLLLLSTQAMADTLYQANVGGYSTGVGVGLGIGVGPAGIPYTSVNSSYYSSYNNGTGASYDSFSYPYTSGCCGCNTCNNCGTSYSNRCQ